MTDVNVTTIETLLRPLASGNQRDVFAMNHSHEFVVKVCNGTVAQNTNEYEAWCAVQHTKHAKWFAPCRELSPDGRVLIQERLSIISDVNDPRLPKRVPKCMTDLKVQNWGVDKDGDVRCADYGLLLTLQNKPWKLKKAKWWSAT